MRRSTTEAPRARWRTLARVVQLSALLWPVGCGSIFGLQEPTTGQDGGSVDSSPPLDGAPGADGAAGYHATAVRFEEAGNDYLSTGMLANTSDSPRGTYSIWVHFNAGDGKQQLLSVAQVIGVGGVLRRADNHFELVLRSCTASLLLDMQSEGIYTTASGWVHLLASWDVSAGRAQLYVNDVSDLAASTTINSGNICYASLKWGFGGLSSGQLDADVADVYAVLGTSIDLDVEAKRRRFSDAAGKPVDLGDQCQNPTTSIPTGCFIGNVATWNTNKGTGAGFTLNGDGLAPAPTSPSD